MAVLRLFAFWPVVFRLMRLANTGDDARDRFSRDLRESICDPTLPWFIRGIAFDAACEIPQQPAGIAISTNLLLYAPFRGPRVSGVARADSGCEIPDLCKIGRASCRERV